MDITAARTFLEIVKTGSFIRAAANLNITQTAVSARVRVLEEQGAVAEADRALQSGLAANPRSGALHYSLGHRLAQAGRLVRRGRSVLGAAAVGYRRGEILLDA